MKLKYVLLLLILAPLLLMGIGPFLASGPVISTTSTPVLGGDMLAGWNFTSGWDIQGTGSIVDANSYSTTGNGGLSKNIGMGVGQLYKVVYTRATTATTAGVWFANAATEWMSGQGTGYAVALTGHIYVRNGGAGNTDVSQLNLYPVTLSSLLAPTRPFSGSGSFSVTAKDTNCSGTNWLGGACYLDSTRNPTKGVFWWANRTTGKVELQILNGALIWVSKVNTAFTYVSGQIPRFDYDATTKVGKVYYNGVQLGGDQDLSAYSWINQNRLHAIYSTTAVTAGSAPYTFIQQ